ncbi:spore coat protein [Heliorestis acidaminivorans]|uniref:Spore coat protein n=1 Tax=Heliorestis acidaminivorans TaxID=553427 RepID=A0A6I0ERV5_9FIRM|nr:spore coat protein [Heliorestis acidaminivorans]KAB2951441.1 spore coat protein [Heliorestis acidaminivorans]
MSGTMKLRKASKNNDDQSQEGNGQQNKKGSQSPSSSASKKGKQNSQAANSQKDLSDRDRLFDVINTEKAMSALCNRVALDSGQDNLYRALMVCLNETQACQRELFHYAQQKGWYSLRPADPLQTQQLYQQYQSLSQQFPYGAQNQGEGNSNYSQKNQ